MVSLRKFERGYPFFERKIFPSSSIHSTRKPTFWVFSFAISSSENAGFVFTEDQMTPLEKSPFSADSSYAATIEGESEGNATEKITRAERIFLLAVFTIIERFLNGYEFKDIIREKHTFAKYFYLSKFVYERII